MGFFDWLQKPSLPEPAYSVMNDDHVRLYQLLGEMRQAAIGGNDGEPARLARQRLLTGLIERLIRESREHFAREEALMALHAYPAAATHRAQHAMLMQQIQTFHANVAGGRFSRSQDIPAYVKAWLTGHIRTHDRDLERFLFEEAKRRNTSDQMPDTAATLARLNPLASRIKRDQVGLPSTKH
jgi:hemerythrin